MKNLEKDFLDTAVDFLKLVTGELDPHTSNKGVIDKDNLSATLLTPSHIQFAKYGRGPGKMPPINNLIAWIKSKGIVKDDKEARGTAFAIAKSISKNGTANYKPNAPNALVEAIEMHQEEFNKAVVDIAKVTINNELQNIYRDSFKEKIKYEI